MMELFFLLPVIALVVCTGIGFFRPAYAVGLALIFLVLSMSLASGAREGGLALLPYIALSGAAVYTTLVQLITYHIARRGKKD